jgi:hypothetical protein
MADESGQSFSEDTIKSGAIGDAVVTAIATIVGVGAGDEFCLGNRRVV